MTHPERPRDSAHGIYMWTKTTVLLLLITAVTMAGQPLQAQTFQVIHNFTGGMGGAIPQAGLTLDSSGNLYGTTGAGGRGTCNVLTAPGCGIVFKLKRMGASWIFQPLYQFTGGSDGAFPASAPAIGPDGAIYGNALAGGQGSCSIGIPGCGVIFKVTPPATFCRSVTCPWVETVLYSFTGGTDGATPAGGLTFGGDRNLYGTAAHGGGSACTNGCGVVFELSQASGSWTENVLHTFAATDGSAPEAGVIFDSSGRLYGTTYLGGDLTDCHPLGCGTVFQLTQSGSNWSLNTLHLFDVFTDSSRPLTNVTIDSSNNLYGTTIEPGGIVFELSPSGQNWLFNVLYQLTGNQGPSNGSLVLDAAGNLYGTTYGDGSQLLGSVFKLSQVGGSWVYTSLHDFTGGSDGAYPYSGLVMDSAGNLYGTASEGGTSTNCAGGCGVIFEITP